MGVGGRAVGRPGPPDHRLDPKLLAEHALEVGKIASGPLLAVGDEPDRPAHGRGGSGGRLPTGCFLLVGGVKHAKDHGRCSPFAGGASQSTQAPMAAVTALVLLPIHGGMTAPKPPAGPPAAMTRR